MKRFAKWVMSLCGWTVKGEYTPEIESCVIVVAPHTSNWDFIWGMMARTIYGIKAKYLIKDSFFKPGLAWFFHFTGGIPVDRSKKGELTAKLIERIKGGEKLKIVFTPEGTRKWVPKWKSGFYYVAVDANLPIVMQYIDYKDKEIGMREPFYPSGDWHADRPIFEAFYHDKVAGNPEQFNRAFSTKE